MLSYLLVIYAAFCMLYFSLEKSIWLKCLWKVLLSLTIFTNSAIFLPYDHIFAYTYDPIYMIFHNLKKEEIIQKKFRP